MVALVRRGKRGIYYLYWWQGGKKHGVSTLTNNWDIAKEIKAQKEVDLLSISNRARPADRSYNVCVEEYLTYARANKKPASVIRDLRTFTTFKKLFDIRLLWELTPQVLEDFKARRLAAGILPTSVNRELETFKAFLTKAAEYGYIQDSPGRKVHYLKVTPSKVRFLSKDEIRAFLAACKGPWLTLAMISLYTGFRLSECLWLTWEDVDFGKNSISVHAKEGWSPKNHDIRTVPLHPRLKAFLGTVPRESPFVVGKYRPLMAVASHIYSTLFKKLKMKGCTFHTLRHTFASHLVMAGVPLYTVSKLLGHTDLETTQIYAHLAQDHLSDSITRLSFQT